MSLSSKPLDPDRDVNPSGADGWKRADSSPVAGRQDILCVDSIDHARIKMMSAAQNANGGEVH